MIKSKLEKFRNKQKCVIIGNGPSISFEDWEWINKNKGEVVFLACNRISLIFDKTAWRPDIYTCFTSNSLNSKEWIKSVDLSLADKNITSFVFKDFKKKSKLTNFHENVVFCKNVKEHNRHDTISENFLDNDLENGILKSYSATIPLFQICDYLDFEEILLIGQDGYTFEKSKNHFDSRYQDEPSDFKKINDRILRVHNILKSYFTNKNIKIFNGSNQSILKNVYKYKNLNNFLTND